MMSVLFLLSCSSSTEEEQEIQLHISAASSLMQVMDEIGAQFSKQHDSIPLQFIYGSSAKLTKQIEQGAPVDVFLSASRNEIDELIKKDKVIPSSVQYFSQNELVLVTNQLHDHQSGLASLVNATNEMIAIGEPEAVPLGIYTKDALEKRGMWTILKNKLLFGSSARQVTTYVSEGHVDLGIVYKSDALLVENLQIIYSFDQDDDLPILYPGAIVTASHNQQEAELFMDFIMGDECQQILKSFGFEKVE